MILSKVNKTHNNKKITFCNIQRRTMSVITTKTTTTFSQTLLIKLTTKRYMHKQATKSLIIKPLPGLNTNYKYSTDNFWAFTKKSSAAKKLATDDTGKHPHKVEAVCENTECEKKKCPQLCDNIKEYKTKGHFTHSPIAGRYSRFICEEDAKSKPSTQYYTKNKNTTKKASAQELQEYKKNGEIIPKPDFDAYSKRSDVSDKLDD